MRRHGRLRRHAPQTGEAARLMIKLDAITSVVSLLHHLLQRLSTGPEDHYGRRWRVVGRWASLGIAWMIGTGIG